MKNLFETGIRSGFGKKTGKNDKTPAKKIVHKKKAFTLVEILIVVAVIGILFIALVPKIDFAGNKARETGVKTDFRAFSLAAEQLLRENAGISKHDTLEKLCAVSGINMYLDPALQLSNTGVSNQLDPWNEPYAVQVIKPTSGNVNNGCIVFTSKGKDGSLSASDDNYAVAIIFVDGKIETATTGFSSNIEASGIAAIEAAANESMTISGGTVTINYKN